MNKPFKILAPVDFSAPSLEALAHAVALARRLGAELVLFSAVHGLGWDRTTENSFAAAYDTDQAKRSLVEIRLRDLAAAAAGPSLPVPKIMARFGTPAPEIVKAAKEEKADMIVMGTHGRTGFARVFLGSVAEGVVRHAPCPVTVLRSGTRAAALKVQEKTRAM